MNAGISVLAGVDNDERLQQTYTHNNKPSRFIASDINDIEIEALREELGIQPQDLILYAACTPCQPFSTLNRQKGKDKRKILLLDFAKIIKKCPPDFILVENVPGLHKAHGKEIYKEFLSTLKRCGFSAAADLLDAKHFGVPQTRKRFILVASRHGAISLHKPQTDPSRMSTVRACIEKYPAIADGEASKAHPESRR